jgi:hypothetical protein
MLHQYLPLRRWRAGFGVNFDGTNANALGRFFFLQVSTKW